MTWHPSESPYDPPRHGPADPGGPPPPGQGMPFGDRPPPGDPPGGRAMRGGRWSPREVNIFAMMIHLCVPVGIAISAGLLSFVAVLAMWLVKKDEEPAIDRHGREVVNALVTLFVWNVVLVTLSFLGLFCATVPLMVAANAAVAIFGVIRAIDAYHGSFKRYPLIFRVV